MKQLQVLFVDDSDLDVMLVVRALRAAGFAVTYARVEQAESLAIELAKSCWDIVICDHVMPAFDALAALQLHTQSASEAPFIIVSGAMPDALAIEAMRKGARDFINKNDLRRLLPVIERELHDARSRALLKQTQASVDRLLYADLLTGLGNLDALIHQAGQCFANKKSMTLLLIDLDRFVRMSQSLGVVSANKVLRIIALRLDTLLEAHRGFVARLGADRFGVVLPDEFSTEKLMQLADEIHYALLEPVSLEACDVVVKVRIGAAHAPGDAGDVDGLLQAAELALNVAKKSVGRGVVSFEATMSSSDLQKPLLAKALLRAVSRNEFVLFFQPQFDLNSGRPMVIEALLRWHCPERGLLLPLDFLTLLEDSGLMLKVGQRIVAEALEQLKVWRAAGLTEVRVAVNVSTAQFRNSDFVASLSHLLETAGVPPADLEIEFTEAVAMGDEEQSIVTMKALKKLGVTLAIDDFGSGYSSLAYLQHFPVDRLKVDQGFVRGASSEGADAAVRALIALAREMNLRVVAEGVETEAQAERMRANGCHQAQGFRYARPMSAGDTVEFLKRWAVA